ncbi:GID complex subunit containing RING finger motif [Ascosphaera aggregata]|nr:GID complex subunit containing RING finger motif [Ascosphaera aggregata]
MLDATMKIAHADHLHLEQSLLHIPNELFGRNIRPAQKLTSRENDNVVNTLNQLAGACSEDRSSPDETIAALNSLIEGMHNLKHRLETLNRRDKGHLERSSARLKHLQKLYEISDMADPRYTEWSRTRMDRLLVDHLTREGYSVTAKRLAEESNIAELVDHDTFESCNQIANKISKGDLSAALSWCSVNKDGLKRKKFTELVFQLRLQQYIEMIKEQDFNAARSHAAKFLDPVNAEKGEVVRQAAAMLVFGPNTQNEPYKVGFRASPFYLRRLFVSTYQSLLLITTDSLQIALTAGLTVLKTQDCHDYIKSGRDGPPPGTLSWVTSLCPICSTELSGLARGLPTCCPMTSVVDPDPVALPNGRVYGQDRLEEYARKYEPDPNQIRDPVTNQSYSRQHVSKVFIV